MQANQGFSPMILIIVGVIVGLAALIWSWYQEQERLKKLERWCAARKLQYSGLSDSHVDEAYRGIHLFEQGFDRYGIHFATGAFHDFKTSSFDYHYKVVVQAGKRRRTQSYWHTVAVIESNVALETLDIRAENILDKVAQLAGFDDINFESAEFSRRFHVKAPNRKWAYDVLHARAMEFLLSHKITPSIHFTAGLVFVWMKGKQSAEVRDQILRIGSGLIKQLPNYIKKENSFA